MHWDHQAVEEKPARAIKVAIAAGLLIQVWEIAGGAAAGVGAAVRRGDEALAFTPVVLLTIAFVIWGMYRAGYIASGFPRADSGGACLNTVVAGAAAATVLKIRALTSAWDKYIYFQYEDYAVFHAHAALSAVVSAPVIEEMIFRGLLFGALLQRGRALAYGVSTAAFILWHVSILRLVLRGDPTLHTWYTLELAALGLLCAYAYERTGRLIVPLGIHAISNGAVLAAPVIGYAYAVFSGQGF